MYDSKAEKLTATFRMEGGPVSNCGSRLSAAHIRLTQVQEFHGLKPGRFQSVGLASAQRTFV
eukprot:1616869-Pyramimonas_sp.AAC.1